MRFAVTLIRTMIYFHGYAVTSPMMADGDFQHKSADDMLRDYRKKYDKDFLENEMSKLR